LVRAPHAAGGGVHAHPAERGHRPGGPRPGGARGPLAGGAPQPAGRRPGTRRAYRHDERVRGMFQRILVPIDDNEMSRRALATATTLAEALGARVLALHVIDPPPPYTTRIAQQLPA